MKLQVDVAGILCVVIDDNDSNLDITTNHLHDIGINVVRLNSVKEMVEVATILRPDVILVAVHMLEQEGYQSNQFLRDSILNLSTHIIALIANDQVNDMGQAAPFGMDDYLIKPYSTELLTTTLGKCSNLEHRFFERGFALKQVLGKEQFLLTMLEKFAKLCTEYVRQLDNYQNCKELALLAHSIKGAAAGLGFCKLAHHAKLLEFRIKETGTIFEAKLVDNLRDSLKQVELYLAIGREGD